MTGLLRIVTTAQALVLVVFLFAGCGGSDTPATTPARTSKTAKAAAGTSTSKAEDMIGQVVVPGELTPKDFKESIESRRPIVVTFYISGPADDNQVRSSILSLESKFRGQVDFYDYLYTDAQRYGDLTLILHVTTTPTVVVINEQAQVQRAWSGYADIKSIEQGINEALGITGTRSGSGSSSYNTSTARTSTTGSSTTGSSTTGSGNTATVGSGAGSGPTP
ncbi:MAG: hypothetical protein HZB44_06745 [Actinobacteria bacterium]|nr:hypothetical protein [Actinomycetota bacterium]